MNKFGLSWLLLLILTVNTYAQKHTPLPHGVVFGSRPSTTSLVPAAQLRTYMGNRARTSAAIVGTVVEVTQSKGGWFTMKAGKSEVIKARFRQASINLPKDLKGREVVISGKASKQFNAFDSQREAGDKSRNVSRPGNKQPILFEVEGLMVNK
ncbi:DUF4920 domain-containing protein [Mucilaginibacter lacusdianchii]|uniref:DUF4920 domain-containing protein n=1 Tax=Mucilaginibacter lacusdianchii TaxID=2684211 RepID=UPI00131D6BD0|nr:DUF4920 domain-containing protein [Mucilaginibacter sp. JXJ CY 39]